MAYTSIINLLLFLQHARRARIRVDASQWRLYTDPKMRPNGPCYLVK